MCTFNSLFEMPMPPEVEEAHIRARTFNSLFEMRCVIIKSPGQLISKSFNSLFEMPWLLPGLLLRFLSLSILYLRCPCEELVASLRRELKPFNSLFEMHSLLLPRPKKLHLVQLSILYLRCGAIQANRRRLIGWPFNSLFEMPTQDGGAGPPGAHLVFQFSI